LHDLFTRGLDANGNLRPTYNNAPELYKESELGMIPKEWEVKKLSSVVEVINGGTPSTHKNEYWNGDIPWLSVEDFNNDNRSVSTTQKKITKEGLKNSSTNLLMPGMIIISARGTVGVISQLKIAMAFNQSCYGLNSISKKLNNDYLYYFLIYYKQNFGFSSFGSVFSTITRDYFDSIFIPLNIRTDETELIVNKLTTIDHMILTEHNYLNKLQMLKAGLMGDLLGGRKEVEIGI
jgi:type I restriction enzyme S subunit